jgi:molecular chaperone GrpE
MSQNHPRQQPEDQDDLPGLGPEAEEQAASEAGEEVETAGDHDPVATLEAELTDTKDKMLRALAEAENMRRRAQRETEGARKYAVTGFARDLLEVADNLGRALASIPEAAREIEAVQNLVEGLEMTQRTLARCFEKQKVEKVEPEIGERFDHNRHQAMFEAESAEQEPGSVIQVMQPGYVIADRLLRPAMVGVAKKPAAAKAPPEGEGGEAPGHRVDTTA